MREADAIARVLEGAGGRDGLTLGPGDDAAVLDPPPGRSIVWTTDLQCEGRHFEQRWLDFEALARRALAVNVSDVAAMGARPWVYLLDLGIPPEGDERDLDDLARGLRGAEEEWGLALAGGHTWRNESGWMLVISLAGLAPADEILRRDTALPGMELWVSGTLGAAARGLEILRSGRGGARTEEERRAVSRWVVPQPRLPLGSALLERPHPVTCLDVSDGLARDLRHLCRASETGAVVDIERLPSDPSLDELPEPRRIELALGGGEDYELLFAVPSDTTLPAELADTPLTRIGEILPAADGLRLRDPAGDTTLLPDLGHDHLDV